MTTVEETGTSTIADTTDHHKLDKSINATIRTQSDALRIQLLCRQSYNNCPLSSARGIIVDWVATLSQEMPGTSPTLMCKSI